jgi:hypothetical protein
MPPINVPAMLPKPPSIITPKEMIRKGGPDAGLKEKVNPWSTPATAAQAIAMAKAKE